MQLTRHAKNKLRLYKWLTVEEAEALIGDEHAISPDVDGRVRYRGEVAGREVTVVVALDNPDLIVTIYAD